MFDINLQFGRWTSADSHVQVEHLNEQCLSEACEAFVARTTNHPQSTQVLVWDDLQGTSYHNLIAVYDLSTGKIQVL